jgi:sugar lactone lactonase YvrE
MKKPYPHSLKLLMLLVFMGIMSNQIFAQSAPNISYNGPQNYLVNKAINPLSPTNTGGAVPATVYGQVSTLAGSGTAAYAEGTGSAASFYNPLGVATDAAGNVYVADTRNNRIRKISPAGVVSTLAGSGSPAYADGTGTAASFNDPQDVATDAAGNLYVADVGNNRIRKISPAGVVTTLAGNGTAAYADGTGTAASFNDPTGVATDAAGNVYVADVGNNRIRKISPAGLVTTFAGSSNGGYADGTGTAASFLVPTGVATDAGGNVYVADRNNQRIRKISPAGVVTTFAGSSNGGYADGTGTAASFYGPTGVATDASGNVYVADRNNLRIRKISPAGVVTTLAGSSTAAYADGTGTAASFYYPYGVATDAVGNVYVADQGNNLIRKISITGYTISPALPAGLTFDATTGIISGTPTASSPATTYTITAYNLAGSSSATVTIGVNQLAINSFSPVTAGTGSTITILGSGFTGATAVAFGGNAAQSFTVISDSEITAVVAGGASGSISVTTPNGASTLAGFNYLKAPVISYTQPQTFVLNTAIAPLSPTNTGGAVPATVYGQVSTFAGSGNAAYADGTGTAASFASPTGVATDATGNVYVADHDNNRIRKISPAGVVTTFADNNQGYTDGTGMAASFFNPWGVATDATGNVYVADQFNQRIRKISLTGVVTTLAGSGIKGYADGTGTAASFYAPEGVATDAAGNVYVADTGNNRIRKISPAGVVTTLAGSGIKGYADGTGTAASFIGPSAVATDAAGNVYVADVFNNRIRKISPGGVVTTLAGSGNAAYADGTGTAASFAYPSGVATDAAGNVYVADEANSRIRKISPAGVVTTLAGSGNTAYADGTGTSASFNAPTGVATDAAGNLYVADIGTSLIRKISLTGYTISPTTLPAGLSFDYTTGTINGTPTAISPATNYTITAYNLAGSSSATVNLTVNLPEPPVISYNSPQSYVVGSAITPLTPSSSGAGTPGYINTPLTIASNFLYPYGVVKDTSGNLYVIDNAVVNGGSQANNALKEIPAGGGTPVTIGTGYQNPKSLAIDLAGNIYVCDQSNGAIYKIPSGGGSQVTVYAGAGLKLPIGIDVDSKGNIYVADYGNNAIKEIPIGGGQPIVLGSGFNAPVGVAVDASGNVYVNDQGNKVIKKIPVKGGSPITIGTGFISSKKLAVDAIGNVFVSDLTGTGGTVSEILVGGNPSVICSGLQYPQGLTIDSLGQVYVADGGDLTIKKIVYSGYHINPALPSGLTFDSQTGTISGTPTVYSSATNYTITASNLGGNGSANLSLAVINPEPIITFQPLNNVVYGVADITPGATSSPAETIIYTSSNTNVATITSNGKIHVVGVGTTNITASIAANTTFAAVTPVTQPLTVNQAPLTIAADNQTKYYGDNNSTLTYKYAGFVNNEDASVLTTPVAIASTATATSAAGTSYPITVSGATAANYSINFVAGTLTVNQAQLTITADNQTKFYSDNNPTLTYKYAGFVNNEDAGVLTTPVAINTTATATSAVGTYPITVSGATAVNYSIKFVAGTLTVNQPPAPTITSLDKTTASAGNSINLTGTYFLGATAVSFGGTAATSFTVNSATSITAIVGIGTSGNVTVTTPSGTGTLAGFNFVPAPTIAASGPTTILSDGAGITLTANPSSGGYTYQWQNNGVNISGATKASYTTTQSGNYTVIITLNGVSQTSAATTVTSIFDLTANNYHLTVTGETCNGSSSGSVAVTADANFNYTGTLSGSGISTITQKFTATTTFSNLPAGTYTLTFTVDGQANYSKAYTVTVTQPQPLSVFATVNNAEGNIELNLSGGSVYHIQLNNKTYTTNESSFIVPLEQGNNALQVTTDRECQGIFTKLINPSLITSPYPMPFEGTLNLNLGSSNIATVSVRIYSANTGLQVFTADYQNKSGVLQLDLSKLAKGAYGLQLIVNNTKKEFKIIK